MSFLIYACKKNTDFSEIPSIAFEDFYFITDSGVQQVAILEFSFEDKDGDLGIDDNNQTNLFIRYFEKQEGTYDQLVIETDTTSDTVNFNGTLPNMTPAGQTRAIYGTIEDTLSFIKHNPYPNDTAYLEIFIKDRSGNKSNIIQTPVFIIRYD